MMSCQRWPALRCSKMPLSLSCPAIPAILSATTTRRGGVRAGVFLLRVRVMRHIIAETGGMGGVPAESPRQGHKAASAIPQGGFGNSTRRLRRKGYYPFRNRGTTPFGIGGLPLTLIGVLPLLRKGYYPPPWHRGTTPLGEGVRTPLGKGVLPPFRKRRCRHFEPALGLHSPRRNRPFAEIQDKGEMTKWPSAGEAATMCGAHTCFHDFHVHMHPDGRWRTRHLPVGAEEPVQRAAGGREPGRNLK